MRVALRMAPVFESVSSGLQLPGQAVQQGQQTQQQPYTLIERYLQSRKLLATAQAEVKKLREHARIEYLGEFEAARTQPVSSGAAGGAVDDHDQSIRKGVAGLR